VNLCETGFEAFNLVNSKTTKNTTVVDPQFFSPELYYSTEILSLDNTITNNLFTSSFRMMQREPLSKLCDVYSYGIFLWELLTQQQPFADVFPSFMVMTKVLAGEVRN